MKNFIKNNKLLTKALMLLFRITGYNKFKIKGKNQVRIEGIQKRGRVLIKGKNNVVKITNPKCNIDLNLNIFGNNNQVIIEDGCILKNLYICIEEDNNQIIIRKNTMICGKTEMFCLEGSKIVIGENCMFSTNVYFTTSDRHSILNEQGERVNKPSDIIINDHVWLGYGTTLLKGASIGENCILGANSVVTKAFEKNNCALAGSPARVVKENINWDSKRLPIKESHE